MERQDVIQAVHGATAEVFSTMLGLEVEPGATRVDHECPSVIDGIMSFVGLGGPWVGSGVVSCGAEFACRLCELFLMAEAPAVNQDVLDTVGELTNMIVGNFKTAAEAVVGPLNLSVPTVIYGRNFTTRSLGNNEWVVFPFKCGADSFEVRIWFVPAESTSHRHVISHIQLV